MAFCQFRAGRQRGRGCPQEREWLDSQRYGAAVAADGGSNTAGDKAAQDAAWNTAEMLLRSVTREELVDPDLAAEDLVFRLFNASVRMWQRRC